MTTFEHKMFTGRVCPKCGYDDLKMLPYADVGGTGLQRGWGYICPECNGRWAWPWEMYGFRSDSFEWFLHIGPEQSEGLVEYLDGLLHAFRNKRLGELDKDDWSVLHQVWSAIYEKDQP